MESKIPVLPSRSVFMIRRYLMQRVRPIIFHFVGVSSAEPFGHVFMIRRYLKVATPYNCLFLFGSFCIPWGSSNLCRYLAAAILFDCLLSWEYLICVVHLGSFDLSQYLNGARPLNCLTPPAVIICNTNLVGFFILLSGSVSLVILYRSGLRESLVPLSPWVSRCICTTITLFCVSVLTFSETCLRTVLQKSLPFFSIWVTPKSTKQRWLGLSGGGDFAPFLHGRGFSAAASDWARDDSERGAEDL